MNTSFSSPFLKIPHSPTPTVNSVKVKNDFLKFLYAAMLQELPSPVVREFWEKQIRPAGDPTKPADFYRGIWQEDAYSNIDFFIQVIESIEPFLINQDIDTREFINNALLKLNRGLVMSAKSMLQWSSSFLEHFFTTADIRYMILRQAEHYTSILFPGLLQCLIQHTALENKNRDILILSIPKSSDSPKGDSIEPLPPFDCEIWTANILRAMPVSMYLQPFEELFILADSRPVNNVIPHIRKDGTNYFIENKKIGKEVDFHNFCKRNSLLKEIQKHNVDNSSVVEITEDYYCPVRKRIVLHKGCVYGASVCLFGFDYLASLKKPDTFMVEIIRAAIEETNSVWRNISKCHEKLMESLEPQINCVYHVRNESMSINGKHLIKSVPAKILRYVIMRRLENNQTEFEYRELRNWPDIITDFKRSNMAVRLTRLSKVLESKSANLKITKTDRGKFRFDLNGRLHYSED